MNDDKENEIKSLNLDEGIIEQAKKISLQFKELIVTAIVLALAVNLVSNILWLISDPVSQGLAKIEKY